VKAVQTVSSVNAHVADRKSNLTANFVDTPQKHEARLLTFARSRHLTMEVDDIVG
jgi:hypothetical protein